MQANISNTTQNVTKCLAEHYELALSYGGARHSYENSRPAAKCDKNEVSWDQLARDVSAVASQLSDSRRQVGLQIG
jgi:hypothetical protein